MLEESITWFKKGCTLECWWRSWIWFPVSKHLHFSCWFSSSYLLFSENLDSLSSNSKIGLGPHRSAPQVVRHVPKIEVQEVVKHVPKIEVRNPGNCITPTTCYTTHQRFSQDFGMYINSQFVCCILTRADIFFCVFFLRCQVIPEFFFAFYVVSGL